MALLRPWTKLAEKLGGSWKCRQYEYNRNIASFSRIQSYVTVAGRTNFPIANTEESEISTKNDSSDIARVNTSGLTIYSQLLKFCNASKNGRIRKQQLVELMKASPEPFGLSVLRYCGYALPNVRSEKRRNLTNQVWALLEKELPVPTLQHYNLLLKSYANNSETVDAKKFLENMKVSPNAETHRLLLSCAAQKGDTQSAALLLKSMKRTGYPITEESLGALILAHAFSGDIASIVSRLQELKDAGISPSDQTWTHVARAYATIGDIANLRKILDSRKLNVEQMMEIVKCLSLSNNGEHITEMLRLLPDNVDFTNSAIANEIMELVYANRAEDAFVLADRVTSGESTERRDLFLDDFLTDLVAANTPVDILTNITNELARKKKYTSAILTACGAALYHNNFQLAKMLFETMHQRRIDLRPHYFWPLFLDASRKKGEVDILSTIEDMLRLNVRLDHDTFRDYIFPHVNTVDIFSMIRKFGQIGLQVSTFVTPLLCYLLTRGNRTSSIDLCTKYSSSVDFSKILRPLSIAYKLSRDVDHCVQVLKHAPPDKSYAEQFLLILYGNVPHERDVPIVAEFIRAFAANGLTVESFQEANGENGGREQTDSKTRIINPLYSGKSDNRILHPQEMSVEELECHLIELRSKGMNKRGVLRKLLMLHCSSDNVSRVNDIKKEYEVGGYLWTPGLYSALLQFYVRHDKIDESRELYALLQRYHSNFRLDHFKVVQYATALVKHKHMDEAIGVLESSKASENDSIAKECWRLLDTVARSEFSEMTETVLDTLVRQGYCKESNSMLGPLVRRHLLKNDLASAIDTFKQLAERHRCTPLRRELICALLLSINTEESRREESMKLLEDVKNITVKLYGFDGLNIDLALSLAYSGMRQELQRLLENHRLSEYLLSKTLTSISDSDKLIMLSEFLECSIYLTYAQSSLIVEQLLSVYSISSDCQGAIELWQKMTDKNIKGSRRFRENFVGLLGKHNVPLPETFKPV